MDYAETWRPSDAVPFEQHHSLHSAAATHPSPNPGQQYSNSASQSASATIPSPPIPSPPLPRRTNSLALEKSDCHICAQKQRNCDRRRRECGTCESFDDTCTGYPFRLQWQDNSTSSTRHLNSFAPEQTPHVGGLSATQTASASQTTRSFKFVGDKPRKPRKSRKAKPPHSRDPNNNSKRPRNDQPDSERAATFAEPRRESHDRNQGQMFEEDQYDATIRDRQPIMDIPDATGNLETEYPINWGMLDMPMSNNSPQNMLDVFNFMSLPNELHDISNFVMSPTVPLASHFDLETINESTRIQIQRPQVDINERAHNGHKSSPESQRSSKEHQNKPSFMEDISGQNTVIQSQSSPTNQIVKPHFPTVSMTQDRFSGLLNMYDRVFCVYPVTGDLEANPFRCRNDTSYGSPHLLHAILAISIYHLGRQIGDTDMDAEAASHKDTAVQLYVNALKSPELHSFGLDLLDSALILFALDATKSAFENWNEQLKRVLGLLEMFGGPEALRHSRRVRAQCAMFVWWDCTISLISRKIRIIPSSYFIVLSTYAGRDGWTWFDLVGCPLPLVGCLMELSDLVAEYEKTREMRWSKFDPSRVLAIQQFLRGWSDQRFANIEEQDVDEEEMHLKRDCHHCTEAWRNALLIYILRIFKDEDVPRSPHAMAYRSRVTLDNVRCCRKSTNVQKQLLLPVFLAACEVSSPDAKVWAKEYCTWWNEKSAYGMFSSVISLLETIWARQTIEGKEKMWWGQVIDGKGSSTIQCLLG